MPNCDKRIRFAKALDEIRAAVVDICNVCDSIEINEMLTFDDPKDVSEEKMKQLVLARVAIGKAIDLFVSEEHK